MDIGALSTAISQSKVQELAGIAVMKLAMDTGETNAAQMTELLGNISTDPNLGVHIDIKI